MTANFNTSLSNLTLPVVLSVNTTNGATTSTPVPLLFQDFPNTIYTLTNLNNNNNNNNITATTTTTTTANQPWLEPSVSAITTGATATTSNSFMHVPNNIGNLPNIVTMSIYPISYFSIPSVLFMNSTSASSSSDNDNNNNNNVNPTTNFCVNQIPNTKKKKIYQFKL